MLTTPSAKVPDWIVIAAMLLETWSEKSVRPSARAWGWPRIRVVVAVLLKMAVDPAPCRDRTVVPFRKTEAFVLV